MQNKNWDLIIKPTRSVFDLRLKEAYEYKDLLFLLVKRDFKAQYKQTILGPLWHLLQPLITTMLFTFIFSRYAKVPTDGSPPVLFYMSGIIIWNFFSGNLAGTSTTFTSNASIFGKVYFPRIIIPLSVLISNGIRFAFQLFLFMCFYFYYLFFVPEAAAITVSIELLYLPLLLLIAGMLGIGAGMMVSAMTIKYRDLSHFLGFAIQLMMYLTPVIYTISYTSKMHLNPMASVVEAARLGFMGTGTINYVYLYYSLFISLAVFLIGLITFNKVEKNFIDTV